MFYLPRSARRSSLWQSWFLKCRAEWRTASWTSPSSRSLCILPVEPKMFIMLHIDAIFASVFTFCQFSFNCCVLVVFIGFLLCTSLFLLRPFLPAICSLASVFMFAHCHILIFYLLLIIPLWITSPQVILHQNNTLPHSAALQLLSHAGSPWCEAGGSTGRRLPLFYQPPCTWSAISNEPLASVAACAALSATCSYYFTPHGANLCHSYATLLPGQVE